MNEEIVQTIAKELQVGLEQVKSTLQLLQQAD